MSENNNNPAWFQTTRWSLILRARASEEDPEHLLQMYWTPVYAFVRRSGRNRHDAEDMTQQFLAQVVLGRDLISRADASRGRFRSYLRTALSRFLIDQSRRAGLKNRGTSRKPLQLDEQLLASAEPTDGDDPDTAFDRQWAARVMSMTLERLEARCREQGMQDHWNAFSKVVVSPAKGGTKAVGITEIAQELGIEDPSRVSNMIQTVKRKFQRELRAVVADTVGDPNEIQEEIDLLMRALS